MLCSRVLSQLNAYIDYELTGAEMLEIREHLSGCQTCAREYASARQVKQLLRGLPTVEADRPFSPAVLKKRPRLRFDLPEWYYELQERLRVAGAGLQRSACHLATGAALAFSVMAISALQAPKRPDSARAHVPESLPAETAPASPEMLQPSFEGQALLPVMSTEGSAYYGAGEPGFYAEMPQVRPAGYSRPHSMRRYQPAFLETTGTWRAPSLALYLELNDR